MKQLLEENVSGFLMGMGRIGGGIQREDDEISWTVGGSPLGYHNAVVRCAVESHDRARALVDEWRAELRARGLPGSWHLAPSMSPSGLGEMLLGAGFVDGGPEPAMAADLAVLPAPVATPAEFTITAVRDDASLGGYRDVLAEGFGEGPKEADWVAAVFRAIGISDRAWHHYVGSLAGQPVCTVSLYLTPPTVGGIYFVSTHPDHRRRGLGGAVTRHAMVEAAARGATTAVLGSSPMGQGVYERLGFRTLFTYQLFEWEPG